MAAGVSNYFDLTGTYGFTVRVFYEEAFDQEANESVLNITDLQVMTSYNIEAQLYYLNGSVIVDGGNVVTFDSKAGTHSVYIYEKNDFRSVDADEESGQPPWDADNIIHNEDGSKTVSISVNITGWNSIDGGLCDGWSVSGTVDVELTTIDRGLIYLDTGSSIEAFQIYIEDGQEWYQFAPYIEDGIIFYLYS